MTSNKCLYRRLLDVESQKNGNTSDGELSLDLKLVSHITSTGRPGRLRCSVP